ncbi:hypothetical protein HNQ07_002763 [Deinococcus metalli]|uniref:Uncharacterized protein n=1 Tax=Deinococcus metalli TaxID=1141878 RepID=A0A7W8KFK7_9DEIO|nr:hypothetical protein [Deinococcus metalli]MBB5377290.1 hypothetical protein [Deinococcus metalli]GHF47588.1 hypothetical protein GCM10017781_24840 [Deinococcus metalli]
MSRPHRPRVPTEALLDAARRASERLTHLSRDPDVRREAGNVAQAVAKLLEAIRKAGQTPQR